MGYKQLDIFSYMQQMETAEMPGLLSVGDKIGRIVLGEVRVATVAKVEGLPNHPFYRVDGGGCYTYEEGLQNIDSLYRQAEKEREKYETITPYNLSERITVEYEPRKCDGAVLWAQLGIFENMLFWKERATYQFCEPFGGEKRLLKEYERHKKEILDDTHRTAHILEDEKPMRRLYLSKCGFYADAEYVHINR